MPQLYIGDERRRCKAGMEDPTSWQWTVLFLFLGGGLAVLALYWKVYTDVFRDRRARTLTPEQTWGYIAGYERVWVAGTAITTISVLMTFYWLFFGEDYSARDFRVFALPGTAIFMAGAIGWPIAVIVGNMGAAALAVVATAVGSAEILAYVTLTTDVAWVWVAAFIMFGHHTLVDGAWAALNLINEKG